MSSTAILTSCMSLYIQYLKLPLLPRRRCDWQDNDVIAGRRLIAICPSLVAVDLCQNHAQNENWLLNLSSYIYHSKCKNGGEHSTNYPFILNFIVLINGNISESFCLCFRCCYSYICYWGCKWWRRLRRWLLIYRWLTSNIGTCGIFVIYLARRLLVGWSILYCI